MTSWTSCPRCHSTGRIPSPIEEGKTYTCGDCAGIGQTPVSPGHYWFYKTHDPKYGLKTARIAHLEVRAEGKHRLTVYGTDGPHYHRDGTLTGWPDGLMDDLRGYRPTQAAAKMLDHWSGCPDWETGMRFCLWLAYENLLRPLVPDTEQIYLLMKLPWPDRLRGAARLKAKYAPDEELF